MRSFEYRHVVGFAETNLVGNVYFAHHVAWQGRCREMFLREHAPGVLAALAGDLRLVTVRVSCQYFAELCAFDEVRLAMTLKGVVQNRIGMRFDYFKVAAARSELVARGEQEVACMRVTPAGIEPTAIPSELNAVLRAFGAEST